MEFKKLQLKRQASWFWRCQWTPYLKRGKPWESQPRSLSLVIYPVVYLTSPLKSLKDNPRSVCPHTHLSLPLYCSTHSLPCLSWWGGLLPLLSLNKAWESSFLFLSPPASSQEIPTALSSEYTQSRIRTLLTTCTAPILVRGTLSYFLPGLLQ